MTRWFPLFIWDPGISALNSFKNSVCGGPSLLVLLKKHRLYSGVVAVWGICPMLQM